MEISVKDTNYLAAKRVTQVGTLGDFSLTVLKLIVGILANSAALVAEGIHSGADLLFDLLVLFGMKVARIEPDAQHPYGHGKFEGLTSILLAMILLAVAVGIVIDAGHRVQRDDLEAPGSLALWIAMGSIALKEFLFQYTIRVGKRIKSNILMANAWHHRADSISSFAALLGIGGALAGWPILDPLAAIAVAFFVGKVGVEIAQQAIHELTDAATSIDAEERARINQVIAAHPEVKSAQFMRARRLGPDIMVDVALVVDPFLSITEGHQIAEEVRHALMQAVEHISEVIVHVDTTESDAIAPQLRRIANRELLLKVVQEKLADFPCLLGVNRLVPHYTPDGVEVDLVLEVSVDSSMAEARQCAREVGKLLACCEYGVYEVRTQIFAGRVVDETPDPECRISRLAVA